MGRAGRACAALGMRAADFDNVIVVDNVPRVSQEKEEKLKNVLRKTFKPCGDIREDGIHLPRGPDPNNPGETLTKGCVRLRRQAACGRGQRRGPDAGAWARRGRGPPPPGPRYAFIEFENAKQARQAVKAGDGFRLDKTHVFACNLFTDIERLASLPDEMPPTAQEPYQERVRGARRGDRAGDGGSG